MTKHVDPTKNVLRLVKKASKRNDDLRAASQRFLDRELYWSEKYNSMRIEYEDRLTQKQSARHDANEETLKILINNVQDNMTASIDRLINRVSAIELVQSQNSGKSSIWANPILVGIILAILGYLLARFTK